jgi:hypothetical protein
MDESGSLNCQALRGVCGKIPTHLRPLCVKTACAVTWVFPGDMSTYREYVPLCAAVIACSGVALSLLGRCTDWSTALHSLHCTHCTALHCNAQVAGRLSEKQAPCAHRTLYQVWGFSAVYSTTVSVSSAESPYIRPIFGVWHPTNCTIEFQLVAPRGLICVNLSCVCCHTLPEGCTIEFQLVSLW